MVMELDLLIEMVKGLGLGSARWEMATDSASDFGSDLAKEWGL